MILNYPRALLAIAIMLLLFGCGMPFLMVIQVVEPTLFLNFLSFGASVLGLFLGVAGITAYRIKSKKKDDDENHYK